MREASLAILNADVITSDPKRPRVEAVAVQGNKFIAVGSNEEIRRFVSNKTEVVDAKNCSVLSGLVDCHVHMTGFGFFLKSFDLRNIRSIKEMQHRLRQYCTENPGKSWIRGGRWDQELFIEKRLPTRWDLDAAVPNRPVLLVRVCGHIGVANSRALQLAKVSKETVVDGGNVDLDRMTSEPDGILRENALNMLLKAVPKPSMRKLEEACLLASNEAVEAGLTCVHWLVDSGDEIRALLKLDSEGKLPLRVYLGVSVELLDAPENYKLIKSLGEGRVRMGFIKMMADGSLGAHTAALNEPYSDEPNTRGMLLYSERALESLVLKAHKAGFQIAIHAIGDRAVESVLKAYEKALKAFPRVDHRHRIEHCSVLSPRLMIRMKLLRVIASVQPHFVVSDFWTVYRLGKKRARWTYTFKTLIRKGLIVVSGSDCPVENINPLLGIWAATTQDSHLERMSVDEAIRTYTANAAYSSFDEKERGTIEVGKCADFTVLSQNLSNITPNKIKDVRAEMTIVDGRLVWVRG